MKCHDVERLGFDAQERNLGDVQRADLAEHLLACDACRQSSERIRAALDAWRSTTANTPLPDVSREWQAVRRRRLSTTDTDAIASRPQRSPFLAWLAIPVAAAAAIAIAMFIIPQGPPASPADGARDALARAQPAVDSATAPTVVFVDEKSGWLVVWATDQPDRI